MRFLSRLVLNVVFIFAAGCAAATGTQAAPLAPPATSEYRLGAPVTDKAIAVAAALNIMEDPLFNWSVPPRAVLVQEMSYGEAYAMLGFGEPGPDQFITWPRDTRVWFVILSGKWTLKPMGPPGAEPIAYEGCLLTIFAARDGTVLSRGDAICPGKG